MFVIRRLRPEEWRAYREIRLRALRESPNAFGSTFEGESSKPDDYWQARVASADTSRHQLPLVAEAATQMVGLVWGVIDAQRSDIAHVIQMWVAPEVRGRGCGARLLESVVDWAREAKVQSVHLRVTSGDTPALRLYLRAGFRAFGDPEALRPGSVELTHTMRLDLEAHAA